MMQMWAMSYLQRPVRRWLAAVLALVATSTLAQPIEVRVEKRGPEVIVDVEATVAAGAAHAWAVLTDYDHMAEFVSTLKSSSVISRRGNALEVAQTGEAKRAFLHFTFSSVRAVELVPHKEIRSRLISGDFKSYVFTTRIVDQGATTLIEHHGEYVPNTWVPPGIGPTLIRDETMKQYGELIAEMLKRQRASQPPPSEPAPAAPPASR
jgi:hypothetical protein